jgi:hypothetical protein
MYLFLPPLYAEPPSALVMRLFSRHVELNVIHSLPMLYGELNSVLSLCITGKMG